MNPMQSRTRSRRCASRGAWLALALVLGAGLARAGTPPPADAGLPDAGAPDARALAAPPPPAEFPTATPPAGAPEAPTLTAAPPALPPLTLDQGPPAAPGHVPFYRKDWFWGAVGVVVLTAAIILFSAESPGPGTPTTTLGDMRAF